MYIFYWLFWRICFLTIASLCLVMRLRLFMSDIKLGWFDVSIVMVVLEDMLFGYRKFMSDGFLFKEVCINILLCLAILTGLLDGLD